MIRENLNLTRLRFSVFFVPKHWFRPLCTLLCYNGVEASMEGGNGLVLEFYWYPNCGTCQKAKKWLDEHEVDYTAIHIVDSPPDKHTLLQMMEKSGLPPKKFFNTSGKKYRESNMKERIKDMTTEDMAAALASDGMLIKRPIVTDGTHVTVGFKEETFQENWQPLGS